MPRNVWPRYPYPLRVRKAGGQPARFWRSVPFSQDLNAQAGPSALIVALRGMSSLALSLDPDRLALTEAAFASADRHWRRQLVKAYGPDAVLIYGYAPEGQGDLGTPLRRSYDARRVAVALWRHERRPA